MDSRPTTAGGRQKVKVKRPPPKAKGNKKKKNDGPTCSLFLAELHRKLKKKQEEEADLENTNVISEIIDSISNALPVTVSKREQVEKKASPIKIENLQTIAPELIPLDTVIESPPSAPKEELFVNEVQTYSSDTRLIKMPLVNSDVFKKPPRNLNVPMVTVAVNTGGDNDVVSEITRHIGTLKRISLIAEEFNQKTAKNLKDIVDTVQLDLIKKLEEAQAEARPAASSPIPAIE